MREVAIVGAGELGGLAAHALARRQTAHVVRLIEEAGRVAEGKALDISQAAAVEGFATRVIGSGDLSALAGADVVVVADRSGATEWQGEEGLALVRRVRAHTPHSVLVCAGASQRGLLETAVRELHVPREKILGAASEALVSAARAVVALELDLSPRDLALSVLGVPPQHIVIGWDNATVAGTALSGMITPPMQRRLTLRIAALWPPGNHALAAAVCKVVDALSGSERRPVTCFIAPDDRLGMRTRAAALPIRLGPNGMVEEVRPVLSNAEQIALDTAVLL